MRASDNRFTCACIKNLLKQSSCQLVHVVSIWGFHVHACFTRNLFSLRRQLKLIRYLQRIYVMCDSNRLVSQMRAPLAACREPAGKLWQLCKVVYDFEHNAQYFLIHAPFSRIVVFWHIGNVPQMLRENLCEMDYWYILYLNGIILNWYCIDSCGQLLLNEM